MVQATANAAAPGGANYQGHAVTAVGTIADLGGFVRDLVKSRVNEVGKLDLADGVQAVQGHANAYCDDRQLRQRTIDHPVRAKLGKQAFGSAEYAATWPHIFAQNDDTRIAPHGGGHRLAQHIKVSFDRHDQTKLLLTNEHVSAGQQRPDQELLP